MCPCAHVHAQVSTRVGVSVQVLDLSRSLSISLDLSQSLDLSTFLPFYLSIYRSIDLDLSIYPRRFEIVSCHRVTARLCSIAFLLSKSILVSVPRFILRQVQAVGGEQVQGPLPRLDRWLCMRRRSDQQRLRCRVVTGHSACRFLQGSGGTGGSVE